MKVLIAEDDKFLLKAYELSLKDQEGIETIFATNGEEAVQKGQQEKPDVIILDMVMPKKSGYEALLELKANKETSQIPVIMLSNLENDETTKEAVKAGAVTSTLKANLSIPDLLKMIRKYGKK